MSYFGAGLPAEPSVITSQRVAGRLRSRVAAWRALGAPPDILDIVEHGYRIAFTVPVHAIPNHHAPANGRGCTDHAAWLRTWLADGIAKGAIAPFPHGTPRHVSRVN
ncbi:MAG: hypothetical protein AAFY08_16665, partial [Planctomycetota bacterium]